MAARTTAMIDLEANAAAAEAASEARADVLARAPQEKKKKGSIRSRARASIAQAKGSPEEWKTFIVDVWITNLNSVEFGIYKHSRNRAKSRQFTSDMDIFAEVIEDGERTGLIGYREDLWRKKEGMDRRLVFKLFNETVNWRATMDLMLGRSLQQTLGARGLPVMAFSVNTASDDHIVYIERSAYKWPLLPENFSFFLLQDGKPEFYRLRRTLIDLGGDYKLYDQSNEIVGYIDGRVFSIGGKWTGMVRGDKASPQMLTVLN